jgi:hypothetical protein
MVFSSVSGCSKISFIMKWSKPLFSMASRSQSTRVISLVISLPFSE